MEIQIKKNHPDAVIPKYAHGSNEDVGMDLVSIESGVLKPDDYRLFKTGISIALPPGRAGRIAPRSGLAYKHGVTVLNADGVIDPGYRGDVGVILINHGEKIFSVAKGDRIAQLIVHKYDKVEWNIVDDLDESKRDTGGFGSTDKGDGNNET